MTARKNPEAETEAPSFEDALDRLETIVEELESGSLSLEQSLRHYEEGMKLSKRLGRTLDDAEQAIETLVEGEADDAPGASESGARAKRRKPTTAVTTLEPGTPGENELPF